MTGETYLLSWIREQIEAWQPTSVGIFREHGDHAWPLTAEDSSELRAALAAGGHLLPLPTEPATLANLIEGELREVLVQNTDNREGLIAAEGTQRSYPDLEFFGERVGGFVAVDIKCARRASNLERLQSRIALYTGNTYFKWPQLKFSGIKRPFADYAAHISLVVLYTYDETTPERVRHAEAIAHPTWRIASTKRASGTREYIASVSRIADLRSGTGEFASEADFYSYWRSPARDWKKSPEADKLLRGYLDTHSRPSDL